MAYDPDLIEPMPDTEMALIKAQIEARWRDKPHYDFDPNLPNRFGSPACVIRADEVLRLIKRAENSNPI